VRIAASEFEDKVAHDDPADACKHILAEEYRCLQVYQSEKDPGTASKRCVKWFDEFQKCQWDQHKLEMECNYCLLLHDVFWLFFLIMRFLAYFRNTL
jgi:hypothetical protein